MDGPVVYTTCLSLIKEIENVINGVKIMKQPSTEYEMGWSQGIIDGLKISQGKIEDHWKKGSII